MGAKTEGKFLRNLTKTNREIRGTRAEQVAGKLARQYKRRIEDKEDEIEQINVKLDEMLDLAPDTAFGLTVAKNFDEEKYVTERENLRVKRRNLQVKLDLLKEDYAALFDNPSLDRLATEEDETAGDGEVIDEEEMEVAGV
jgi:hypothetical protein